MGENAVNKKYYNEKSAMDAEVNKIQESFSMDLIGWKGTNTYYQNPSSKLIEVSEQKIHPRLPVAKVEFYFKY